MTDVLATPASGEGDHRTSYYHDEANGSFALADASHLRGWDTTDGAWYRVPVDHATGALVVKATLAAGTVDVGIVDQGTGGSSAWKVTDAALADGTLRVGGTVAVSGPLTDTQLRATPVPISGTVTATTGGLTDTQLRASAVPVSLASLPALAAGSAVIGHVIVDSGAITATLAAETTKVIGTVNQGTSPWVTSASVSNFPATQAVSNAGTFAVQDTTGMAADMTGTLPAVVQVIGGYDGTNVHAATMRFKDGVGMLHTADQQVRQELEFIHLLMREQIDILRQLVGERADLN